MPETTVLPTDFLELRYSDAARILTDDELILTRLSGQNSVETGTHLLSLGMTTYHGADIAARLELLHKILACINHEIERRGIESR